jgi:hypothetical protein
MEHFGLSEKEVENPMTLEIRQIILQNTEV